MTVGKIINSENYEPWYKKENYTAHHTNGEGFVLYSDAEGFCETLSDIHMFMHDSGMIATHNMPCPVCKTNHAVFILSSGYFTVCHECKNDGWAVTKTKEKKLSLIDKMINWLGFKGE